MSEILTVAEVAEKLRVDGTTVRRWIHQGTLEAVLLPRIKKYQSYRIRQETLDKLLNPEHAKKHKHHAK